MSVRSVVRRLLRLAGLAILAGLIYDIATLPPRTRRVDPGPWRPRVETAVVRGAVHVHTNRSDGTGSVDDVAAAASRAGLDFVIVTDHGDATRSPDPPAYRAGVLCLDGVEISTTGGHYVAYGLPAAPYPLAGDPAGVVEDVRRLGGLGIAAHPDSRKRSLQWRDWRVPIDGFEWLNADSEWRDESRGSLARTVFRYPFRGPETLTSLLDRPADTLRRWDEAGRQGRRLIALAGADAHARIGPRGTPDDGDDARTAGERWSLPLPSYEAVFRMFSTRVALDQGLSGDAASDARSILEALRAGRVFSVIDGIATPGAFEFFAETAGGIARMGDVLPLTTRPLTFRARGAAPAGAEIRLVRNGAIVARSRSAELAFDAPEPSVGAGPQMYRVEVEAPGAPGTPPVPWIVTNAVYLGAQPAEAWRAALPPAAPEKEAGSRAAGECTLYTPGPGQQGWLTEHGPGSLSALHASEGRAAALAFEYRLDRAEPNAFAAIARRLDCALRRGDAIRLRARSSRPLRLSVQVRVTDPRDDLRWSRSVYLDQHDRDVVIAVEEMAPVTRKLGEARRADADVVLLVVDRTNNVGGASGRVWIGSASIVTAPALRSAP